ncbi:MAG: hypothetical protein LBD29_05940, partial [Treponema sp.]|nr:hypothetical protein [Treponema sp.]
MRDVNVQNQPLESRLKRWRLILGRASQEKLEGMQGGDKPLLDNEEAVMDGALAAIYDNRAEESGTRGAGLGPSYPNIAKWLRDIRTYFPADVVSVIQGDAIERK